MADGEADNRGSDAAGATHLPSDAELSHIRKQLRQLDASDDHARRAFRLSSAHDEDEQAEGATEKLSWFGRLVASIDAWTRSFLLRNPPLQRPLRLLRHGCIFPKTARAIDREEKHWLVVEAAKGWWARLPSDPSARDNSPSPKPVNAYAWVGVGHEGFVFPEMRDDDALVHGLKMKSSFGVCLSGGGNRAASLALGWLRALHSLDLKKVRYLSSNSGGSWLNLPSRIKRRSLSRASWVTWCRLHS